MTIKAIVINLIPLLVPDCHVKQLIPKVFYSIYHSPLSRIAPEFFSATVHPISSDAVGS